MRLKPLLSGVASYVPGVRNLSNKETGGTISAEYCYSVWLRHLVLARQNNLNSNPKVIAELGPGDSIGIGLAALLCGAEKYYAFDVVEYASIQRNLSIFDDLLLLFKNKKDIPCDQVFPRVKPKLDCYSFPDSILDQKRMLYSLAPERVARIRNAIENHVPNGSIIEYKAPWYAGRSIAPDSVDMIFSQAVLEHVDDLEPAYSAMNEWLDDEGFVSHQIDFKCHGIFNEWNGHWGCSKPVWKMIRGKKSYLLNREPCSTHINNLINNKFKIVCQIPVYQSGGIARGSLAKEFVSISDEDFKTSGVFIQAKK